MRNHSKNILREGMRAGDLAELVLPLISVDEYESKINSKSAIVVGFYVHDKDAANDLNRFIQKSPVSILDVEVSPAPDQHGYYFVFVEFLDNDKFASNVGLMLKDIESLVDITNWKMRVRKSNGLMSFSVSTLTKAISTTKQTNEATILSFLTNSDLENAYFDEDTLIIESRIDRIRYEVVGYEPNKTIGGLGFQMGYSIGLRETLTCNRLELMLGCGWVVESISGVIVLKSIRSGDALLLKPLFP